MCHLEFPGVDFQILPSPQFQAKQEHANTKNSSFYCVSNLIFSSMYMSLTLSARSVRPAPFSASTNSASHLESFTFFLNQGWGTCGLKATCGLLSHEVRPSVAYGSSLKLKLRIIHLTPKSSKYQFCKR